jgi:hypothetical protein
VKKTRSRSFFHVIVGVSSIMDESIKLIIITFLKANFAVGVPLYFCCFLWLQYKVGTLDEIWLFFELSILISSVSFIIGLAVLLPFITFAKNCGFVSYPSIVLCCLYEPKLFYLYSMAISAVIGVVFIKLIGKRNVCS